MRIAVILFATFVVIIASTQSALSKSHHFPTYWPTAAPTMAATADTGAPVPSGISLIKTMYGVMRRFGSVHIAIAGQFLEPGVETGTLQGTEDVSLRSSVEHYLGHTQVTALSNRALDYTAVQEVIAVKHVQASRGEAGEIPEAWLCEGVPGKFSDSYFVVYQWKHLVEAKNQGLTVVDGRSAWHVTAFAIWKEGKKHLTHYEPIDYYIAQSDNTLVRELTDAAMNGPDKLIPYTQVLDYSAYGQPVPVTLPKACTKHKK